MASNKMNIEWHKACLYNSRIHEDDIRKQLEKVKADLEESHAKNLIYAYQIEEAEKEGKTEFDRDRFRVKREKK